MAFIKRIFLFFVINALVVVTLSLVLNILNVRPYLTAYGIDYKALMAFCLVWGMGGALISLALSRQMAKWLMGVKIINENTADPDSHALVTLVHKLAREANLPGMPQVGIYDSPDVNAFATGPTKRRSLVAVSRGLLNKMSPAELEGVVAHEMSHIANGDMVTMTLLQGIVNAFVMFLARILASIFSGMGRNREQSNNSSSYLSYTLLVFLFEVVFMILGQLVVAAYSRFREFRADAGGAKLAGKQKMISALESLLAQQNTKKAFEEKPAIAAFKISRPNRGGFFSLLATHPPLEQRIARLQENG